MLVWDKKRNDVVHVVYGIGHDWKPLEGECVILWNSLVFAYACLFVCAEEISEDVYIVCGIDRE